MESEDKIGRWIDEALRQYSNADAGPGFEARVLARVKEREGAVRARQPLWWAFSFVAVVITVVLLGLWFSYEPHRWDAPLAHRQFDDGTTKTKALPSRPGQAAAKIKRETSTERHTQAAVVRKRRMGTSLAGEPPKADRFPSPAPLSEEEQILARYVSEHRQHAVMLARAETDLLERERRERNLQFSGSEPSLPDNEK